ncbi:MAG: hypothetical protein ACYDHU_02655 [Acidimicrobiales bacterium]
MALAAGIGIGVWIAPTSPAATARSLMRSAIVAATRAGTFHYAQRSTTNGLPDNIIGTAAPNSGRQTITQRGSSGTDVFDLRLVHGVVYFRGNEAAVVDQLGVSVAHAPGVTERWVSIRHGEAVYQSFEDGITTKSNLSQITSSMVPQSTSPISGTASPQTQIAGEIIVGKHKVTGGAATLDVTNSTSLPTSLTGRATDQATGASISLTWTFNHWRERVNVRAPASSTPYSSLGAIPPSPSGG